MTDIHSCSPFCERPECVKATAAVSAEASTTPSDKWKLWKNANPELLEPWYSYWASHLTSEKLHAKADIATVLALLHQQRDDLESDYMRLLREKQDRMITEVITHSARVLAEASRTPRTDAFWAGCSDEFGIEFARQLERELAEAQTIIEAHEAVRDACLEALPECQAWGDVLGWIEQMKSAVPATAATTGDGFSAGRFHCACVFERPKDFHEAALVEECAYHKHARAVAAPSDTSSSEKDRKRLIDNAISDLAQLYGLIEEGEYDKASDYCKAAAEWYTQEIASLTTSAKTDREPIGYAVIMDEGGFVGAWKSREIAELVCSKQPPSHHDRVVAIYDGPAELPSSEKDRATRPLEPTAAMIEEGAQRLVRWETGEEVWPDSWDGLQVAAARQEAERVWRSMWIAASDTSSATPRRNEP